MRVYCRKTELDVEVRTQLGPAFYAQQAFHITRGREYVVLGLRFEVGTRAFGTGVWVDLVSDFGRLISAPLGLFDILDARLPGLWEIRHWPDGGVTLWPPSFYRDYYHDDLSNDVADVVEDFRRVKERIEAIS